MLLLSIEKLFWLKVNVSMNQLRSYID